MLRVRPVLSGAVLFWGIPMKPLLAIFAVAAALGAGGCNRSAEAGASVEEKAFEYPVRAAGLWRETHMVDGKKAPPVKQCVKSAQDLLKFYRVIARDGDDCSEYETTAKGQTINVKLVCKQGKSTVTKKTRANGDFRTRFTIETVTTMNPVPDSFGAKALSTYTITAERTGDC
jgi:hypothetical protein